MRDAYVVRTDLAACDGVVGNHVCGCGGCGGRDVGDEVWSLEVVQSLMCVRTIGMRRVVVRVSLLQVVL